jgi:hypothetical protein
LRYVVEGLLGLAEATQTSVTIRYRLAGALAASGQADECREAARQTLELDRQTTR